MQVADSSILRLTKELAWIEKEILPNLSALRTGQHSLFDSIFANELAIAVHAAHEVSLHGRCLPSSSLHCQSSVQGQMLTCLVHVSGSDRRPEHTAPAIASLT